MAAAGGGGGGGLSKIGRRLYKKPIYRYHDGAQPGDEIRALPDPGNPNRLNVIPRGGFPGLGSVRYEHDRENNRLYRLHDGARSPLSGNFGWTAKELEASFLNFQRQQDVQRKHQERTERRRQARYEEILRSEQAAREEMTPQERQIELIQNLELPDNIPGVKPVGEIAKFLMGQAADDKSVMSRTMDVLSRPLYAVTNVLDSGLERNADRLKSGNVRDILSGLADMGSDVASLAPFVPRTPENTERRNRVAREAWQGFSGKDKVFTSDLLRDHFDVENSGVLFTAGLAGDILLDPTTYLSGGTSALARTTTRGVLRAAGRDVAGSQSNVARWARNETRAPARSRQPAVIHDGPFTPTTLDEIVRADLPTTEKIRYVDELVTAQVRPTAQNRAREIFDAQLQDLRQTGKITDDELGRLVRAHGTTDLDSAITAATRPRQAAPIATLDDDLADGAVTPAAASTEPAVAGAEAQMRAAARQVAEQTRLAARTSALRTSSARAAALARGETKLKQPLATVPSRLRATASAVRTRFRDSKTTAGRVFIAQERVTKTALDAVRQTNRMITSGRASQVAFPQLDSLTRLADQSWLNGFVQTFGKGSQIIEEDIKQVARNYISNVGKRPDPQAAALGDEVGDQAYRDSLAWHAGLYSAVANHYEGRVLDTLGDEILRDIANSGDTALLNDLMTQVPSASKGVEEAVTEATPPEIAEAFAEAATRFDRETPEALQQLAERSTRIAERLEDSIKTQMYEIIAQSDHLPLPSNVRLEIMPDGRLNVTGMDDWDSYMAWRSEVQVPAMAAKSYNNTFARLFSASYGQNGAMDDLKRRLLGNANARVAYERDLLTKSPLARLPRRERRKQFGQYRPGAPATPAMQWMDQEVDRILGPYVDTDHFGTAFGLAGQPNLGDLNRWLSRSPFRFELIESPTGARRFSRDIMRAVPKRTDPLEFLFQLSVANEKVLVEKATLNAIADTFGVRNIDSLATSALKERGYVVNGVFGNQVLFHPEISRQVERLHELTSRADALLHPAIDYFQKVQNIWKRAVTVYNPGFHVRNLIGDGFKNYIISGVSPRSSTQAASLMRATGAMDPEVVRLLQSPSTNIEDALAEIGDLHRNFVKLRDKSYLSIEEVYAEYIRGGLSGTQISTQMGVLERTPGVNAVRRFVSNPAEKLADATSQFARLSLFIDQVKKGKGSHDEIFQRAVEEVRKVHYDYGHMTHFERAVMSTVIPFYRFLRNNYPFMASILFTKPGRATIPDKALQNWSESQGFEHNEGMPWAGFVAPDWVTDRTMWPIVQTDDGVIFAQPDYEFNSVLRDLGTGDAGEAGLGWMGTNVSPIVPALFQAGSGQQLSFGEIEPDPESGRNPLPNFINTFPQYRAHQDLAEDKEYDDPGRWAQILGLGTTRTVGADDAIAAAFNDIPGVQEASDRRAGRAIQAKEKYERKGREIDREVAARRSNTDILLELIRNESIG